MLHPKALHYPSGFPMPRSPPLFICSSPGPDPYRSHDNVYEELEHRPDSGSERAHHSDDEFAEDELSLPGERSFQKSSPDTTTVATIYQERSNSSSNGAGSSSTDPNETYMERNRTERNSLLSSSSSNNDNHSNSTRPIRNSNSSSDCGGTSTVNSIGLSLFRCRSSNNNKNNSGSSSRQKPNSKNNTYSADELNITTIEPSINGSDIPPAIYDDRSLLSLPPSYSNSSVNNNSNNVNNNLNHLGNNTSNSVSNVNNVINNNNNVNGNRGIFYSSIDDEMSEVERRNRINSQMSQHPVATIFRERNNPRIHHHHHSNPNRARTNPRSLDRRRLFNNPPPPPPNGQDPTYMYQEPIFHERLLYDTCMSHPYNQPYILPEFTTFRHQLPNGSNPPTSTAVYSRDSSFGSDSGYSHNTQNSNQSNSHHINSWWRRARTPKNVGNNVGGDNSTSRSGTLNTFSPDS